MRALVLLAPCVVFGAAVACGGTSRPAVMLDWRIGLDQRIGAVTFGERQDRVDAVLGPGVVKQVGGYTDRLIFYRRAALYIAYYPHGGQKYAIGIITRSPRYRTASGAGVGTTLEQLGKLPQIVCDGDGFEHGVLKTPSSDPSNCDHPRSATDHPFTSFTIDYETKRVTQVAIFPGGD